MTQLTAQQIADHMADTDGLTLVKEALALYLLRVSSDRLHELNEENEEEPPTAAAVREYADNFWVEIISPDLQGEVSELINKSND